MWVGCTVRIHPNRSVCYYHLGEARKIANRVWQNYHNVLEPECTFDQLTGELILLDDEEPMGAEECEDLDLPIDFCA